MMVDDEVARSKWRARLHDHCKAIMKERGLNAVLLPELARVDTPFTAALAQAYHEGLEGARKRGL
jgi:hypothetical protein